MSTTLFERLRDGTGKRLLDTYGDVFRITKNTGKTFDPTTGEVTASSVSQDVMGKAFTRNSQLSYDGVVGENEIEIYLTASGNSFEPEKGQLIKTPGTSITSLTITRIERIPESGTVVIYKVFAER